MILGSAQSIFAQDSGPNTPVQDALPEVQQQQEREIRFANAIRRMEQHLTVGPDGLLHLNVDRNLNIGVPDNILDEFQASMHAVNEQVQAGAIGIEDVRLSSGRTVLGPEIPQPSGIASSISGNVPQQAVACAGWTGMRWFWHGPRLHLNECQTQTLQGALGAGFDAFILCAANSTEAIADIPVGIACGLAAGLAGISAEALHAIDSWGGNQGIYFQFTWVNWVGWQVNWMWHQ